MKTKKKFHIKEFANKILSAWGMGWVFQINEVGSNFRQLFNFGPTSQQGTCRWTEFEGDIAR